MLVLSESDPLELDLHDFSNMSEQEFKDQLAMGKRYVVYQYALSIVVVSFRHPTRVHIAKSRKHAIIKGLPWTLLTLVFGWWSIPSGPIFTLTCLSTNLSGGLDVSSEILEHIRNQDPRYQYGLI